jgi:uncharacterized protein
MRILLDSNILISFLLKPLADNPIVRLMHAVVAGRCELLLPVDLLEEVRQVVRAKRHLARRIALNDLDDLIEILSLGAVEAPDIPGDVPALTRDPKDDYLLACAVVGLADYIVTGDDDLLVLKEVEGVRMVSAREFWEILDAE